jgi:hypothetical protein
LRCYTDAGARPVVVDLTCLVAFGRLWNLTRVDLTRSGAASGEVIGASSHKLLMCGRVKT